MLVLSGAWHVTFAASPGAFPHAPMGWYLLANLSGVFIAVFLVLTAVSNTRAAMATVLILCGIAAVYQYRIWLAVWYDRELTRSSGGIFSGVDQADSFLILKIAGGLLFIIPLWLAWGVARRAGMLWIMSIIVAVMATIVLEVWYRSMVDDLVENGRILLMLDDVFWFLSLIFAVLAGALLELMGRTLMRNRSGGGSTLIHRCRGG